MKALDIALKDLTRSFRSYFALALMFGVPILVTSLFSLMFGSQSNQAESPADFAPTRVIIANLDEGKGSFSQGLNLVLPGEELDSAGAVLIKALQDEQLVQYMEFSTAPDAASARLAVDQQQAGVAIIIPEHFSEDFSSLDTTAALELYQDPTLTLGTSIVRSILSQILEGFSGTKIMVQVALAQGIPSSSTELSQAVLQYLDAALPIQQDPGALIDVRSPDETPQPANPLASMVGGIMGGMLIFFAFFTGASTAQSILTEDEQGTLPRLFTTPTSPATILSGKFLAVGLTVIVQVCTLLVISRLIFGIHWGAPLPVILAAASIMLLATAFGIWLMSLLKNARQGGSVIGGALTVTGMLGMMPVFMRGAANAPRLINTVSLLMPQGWANRILLQSMEGTAIAEVGMTSAIMLVVSLALFTMGVLRFQKRYA